MSVAVCLLQMLDTQDRRNPAIALFPAAAFYGGALGNGEGVEAGSSRAWHEHLVRHSSPACLPARPPGREGTADMAPTRALSRPPQQQCQGGSPALHHSAAV